MIRIKRGTLWHFLWEFNRRWSVCPPNSYDTNLCQFMRCVLVWLPLKFISVALLLSVAIVWWETSLQVSIGLSLMAALIFALGSSMVYFERHPDKFPRPSETLIWQYVKAKKQKICPLIYVE
jgi:hypothetical protein